MIYAKKGVWYMLKMENWLIVSSKMGKTLDGFPCGQYLCRSEEDVKSVIKDKCILDPLITKYSDRVQNGMH